MKRILSMIAMAVFMALCLIGCGKKTETARFVYEEGVLYELTVEAEDGNIKKWHQVTTADATLYGREILEQSCEEIKKQYKEYENVAYSYEITDTESIETIDIDFSDLEALKPLVEAGIISLPAGYTKRVLLEDLSAELSSLGWERLEE